ncbi:MAG: DUF1684 domain-containing protein [Propionibacteriaceae bacterium]|jgi:uncharacterized protein (DUF1684 family)|nr:DUF1684 domain-containing protein [Propionibacteriaceae bacterium]
MPTDPTSKFAAFRARREAYALAPFSDSALIGTHYLSETPETVDPIAGTWYATPDAVVGVGLDPADVTDLQEGVAWVDGNLVFAPEKSAVWRGLRLLAIARIGLLGLRVFDPEAETRTTLAGIDVYGYDPQWVIEAEFVLLAPEDVEITLVTGRKVPVTVTAQFTFQHPVDGQSVTMQVNGEIGQPTSISFLDTAAKEAGAPLRFLPIRWPEGGAGKTVVDFNYATLPPCSFSPHFMCPLPLPGNRLSFPVRAGERALVRK